MIHFYLGNTGVGGLLSECDPGAVSEERNLTFSGGKRKDLYSEILFVFKSYQADKISLFILGKSVRRGKISPAVVSDPGVDAVVPGFKTGG